MESEEIINVKIDVILNIFQQGFYPKEWRRGQAIFNLFYVIFPSIVEQLRNTKFDCFYDNNKIEIFINKVKEINNYNLKNGNKEN